MKKDSDGNHGNESSLRGKIGRWYTAMSLVLVNTFLAAVICLMLLDMIIDLLFERQRVYSDYFIPQSYGLSTPDEVRKIGAEFDRMGAQESFAYNPWTTFTERPFRGELVNIDETQSYPTRRTVGRMSADQQEVQEKLLVWTFGGSTMFGWGVSDKNTVASHLQQKLQDAMSGYQIRVVNHGHAYFFSSQEVSLCVALLRHEERPDVIVFLDGLNDVSLVGEGHIEPFFAPQAVAGWEAERKRRFDPESSSWLSFSGNFPLYRVLRHLQLSDPQNAVDNQVSDLEKSASVRRIVDTMRINREIASAVTRRLGIKTLFFLQPLPLDRSEQDLYLLAYPVLREAALTDDTFFDISQPLENDLQYPYVDRTHYSDSGSQLVAERIADAILSSDLK